MIYKFKTFSKQEASTHMSDWIASEGKKLPKLDSDYQEVRTAICNLYEEAVKACADLNKIYIFDVNVGVRLKIYLDGQPWFNQRLGADDGFWSYLSIMIVPDLVAKRFPYDNEEHYYNKGTRIWLRTVWELANLGWCKDLQNTVVFLCNPNFSTDTILNMIERTSTKGADFELYRLILIAYSAMPKEAIKQFKDEKGKSLFRSIMCLNTAKTVVIEPGFYENGKKGYVKSLFEETVPDYVNCIKF